MKKTLFLGVIVACFLGFTGRALATQPDFIPAWILAYDGYLTENTMGYVSADTLITVFNSHPSRSMGVFIEVYDKHGLVMGHSPFYNGGLPLPPPASENFGVLLPLRYGWVTLGMIVTGPTHDPWGFTTRGEKFSYKIYTTPKSTPPVVEVKQVIYSLFQEHPGEVIWNTENFKTWTETSLGGLYGTGLIKVPLPQ